MAPKRKAAAEANPPKAATKGGAAAKQDAGKSLRLSMGLGAKPAGGSGLLTVEDIKADAEARLQALYKAADEGLHVSLTNTSEQLYHEIIGRAKEHHKTVSAELASSQKWQEQAESEHNKALAEIKRAQAEATQSLGNDKQLTELLRKLQKTAQDDLKQIQQKYVKVH